MAGTDVGEETLGGRGVLDSVWDFSAKIRVDLAEVAEKKSDVGVQSAVFDF